MKKSHTSLLFIGAFFTFLFLGLLMPLSTFALNFPEGKEDLYIQNNILFYEPGEETRNFILGYNYSYTSYFGCGSGTGNTNYRGEQIWSKGELALIEKNKSVYQSAANSHGLPWEILAVVHYQEHSLLKNNPKNGQGIFQLTDLVEEGKDYFTPTTTDVSDEEFLRQANLSADELKAKAQGLDLSTSGGIKRLFFKYNGTAQVYVDKAIAMGFSEADAKNGEGSPYVMNRYDAARDPKHPETMDPRWKGLYVADHVYDENATDSRVGTYVRYLALVGIFENTSTNTSAAASANDPITKVALTLAKKGQVYHDQTPSEAYKQTMIEVKTYHALDDDADKPLPGASCDVFLSTVIRKATGDLNFPATWKPTQQEYMDNHPELFQKVNHQRNVNNLRSGDIMVAGKAGDGEHRHVQFFVLINGKPGIASASHASRTGQYFESSINFTFTSRGKSYDYDVYRYVGNGVGGGINQNTNQPCTPQTQSSPAQATMAQQAQVPYPTNNLSITEPKQYYSNDDFKKNSDKIACPANTLTVGTYNNAHYKDSSDESTTQVAINLCEVPNIKYSGQIYTGMEGNNILNPKSEEKHAVASSLAAEAFYNFAYDYKQLTGKTIKVTQSFRTYEFQDDMYKCAKKDASSSDKAAFTKKYGRDCSGFSGPAPAGSSKHESGLAMDLDMSSVFKIDGDDQYGYDPNSCKTGAFTSATKTDSGGSKNKYKDNSRWTNIGMAVFCEMLPKYGLKLTVSTEPWHLQYVGK